MTETVCKRCGACCHLKIEGKLTNIPCRYLVKVPNSRTLCRIYKNRLGQDIGLGNKCMNRTDDHHNYPGCPYNKPEWEDA